MAALRDDLPAKLYWETAERGTLVFVDSAGYAQSWAVTTGEAAFELWHVDVTGSPATAAKPHQHKATVTSEPRVRGVEASRNRVRFVLEAEVKP